MKIDKIVLNKSKLRLQNVIRRIQLHNTEMDILEMAGGDLIVRIQKICVSGQEKIIKETQFPCNWWEAFRERWFFKWWLRLYPVQYRKVITKEIIKMCPHLAVSDHSPHVIFLMKSE